MPKKHRKSISATGPRLDARRIKRACAAYKRDTTVRPQAADGTPRESTRTVAGTNGEEAVVLCRWSDTDPRPPGTLPAPRTELLCNEQTVRVMRLLRVFSLLPQHQEGHPFSKYRIWITQNEASVPLTRGVPGTPFCDLAELIDILPLLTAWLAIWAESPGRSPCLTPDWARALHIDARTVQRIADDICRSVACADALVLCISDLQGHHGMLALPAKATLKLPRPKIDASPERVHIDEVQDTPTAITPGGKKILLTARTTEAEFRGGIRVDPSRLKRAHIRVPQRIFPCTALALPKKGKRK